MLWILTNAHRFTSDIKFNTKLFIKESCNTIVKYITILCLKNFLPAGFGADKNNESLEINLFYTHIICA
jgi:hypothetical protein